MNTHIQAFFGEAFFNILNILSACNAELPQASNVELRLELLGRPSRLSRNTNPRPLALCEPMFA
jgi:hypothetical protein